MSSNVLLSAWFLIGRSLPAIITLQRFGNLLLLWFSASRPRPLLFIFLPSIYLLLWTIVYQLCRRVGPRWRFRQFKISYRLFACALRREDCLPWTGQNQPCAWCAKCADSGAFRVWNALWLKFPSCLTWHNIWRHCLGSLCRVFKWLRRVAPFCYLFILDGGPARSPLFRWLTCLLTLLQLFLLALKRSVKGPCPMQDFLDNCSCLLMFFQGSRLFCTNTCRCHHLLCYYVIFCRDARLMLRLLLLET